MKNQRYIIFMEILIFILALVSFIKEPEALSWKVMAGMGLGTISLLLYRKKFQLKQEKKEKEQFFRKKYPMFAGNVSLLIQSGMSPKSTFLYLEQNYGLQKDPLKEALSTLKTKLVSGYGESMAYKEFGEACMEKEYRRLMSLVTQYLEQGSRYLVVLLELEMREAHKARIRNAKQEGEQMSAKMLLPIGILFLDVIIIVIAPIMSSIAALQGL